MPHKHDQAGRSRPRPSAWGLDTGATREWVSIRFGSAWPGSFTAKPCPANILIAVNEDIFGGQEGRLRDQARRHVSDNGDVRDRIGVIRHGSAADGSRQLILPSGEVAAVGHDLADADMRSASALMWSGTLMRLTGARVSAVMARWPVPSFTRLTGWVQRPRQRCRRGRRRSIRVRSDAAWHCARPAELGLSQS
jgi:hypothetical protein